MRRLLASAASCGLVLTASALLAGCGGGEVSTRSPSGAPAGASGSPRVPDGVAVTELDDRPVGLAPVGGTVWAALPDAGQVLTARGRAVKVGRQPLRLVATPQGVWVSAIGDGTVVRVDPATGEVDRRTVLRPRGSEPEGLAYDGHTVWVVDQAGDRVLPLDPATGRLGTAVDVGIGPRLVTAGPDGVYVSSFVAGSVTRVVDGTPTTRDAAPCLTPQGLAEAAGVVWVACTSDGQVVGLGRADARAGRGPAGPALGGRRGGRRGHRLRGGPARPHGLVDRRAHPRGHRHAGARRAAEDDRERRRHPAGRSPVGLAARGEAAVRRAARAAGVLAAVVLC
ncbi:hypothetical protein [Nocardioides ungokensis]|uniref:hypothetical protein n=1 Tax=Nocardioides ungokensis TaxID=1643322 RepID=UPI0015E05287|nr:hypothetical protein [Nocardioides ungokensis]